MFKKARIRLSFYYVAIIAVGMIIFSTVFYVYSVQDIRHDASHDTSISAQTRAAAVSHTLGELEGAIIVSNLVILLILSFLAYLLAGKTLKPIQEALDAQERFSANASHELRTPLAVMKLENEIFLDQEHATAQDARALAKSNLEEIDRMAGMVQSLLVLARNKATHQLSDSEPFDLSHLVSVIVQRIERLHHSKDIRVELSVLPNVELTGDRKLVEQAITNIVQNAFAYTREGFIRVSVGRDRSSVTVRVSDSGIGIDDKDLRRITEPFFKADRSRTQSVSSFGLGLSIVQEVVELHKGTFSIESVPGQGTTAILAFPVA